MKWLIAVFSVFAMVVAPGVAHAEEISVSVKGMVCSFCAQGIKKTFSAQKEVEKVAVDLDKKIVSITTKQGETVSDEGITQAITDAGFEVVEIKRQK
jgi:copper chaperone CopZ